MTAQHRKLTLPGILSLCVPDELRTPVVFDSPHSGNVYPDDFDYDCAFDALERAEDRYVDELFSGGAARGVPMLSALFPRSYIDVNRHPADIDTGMIDGKISLPVNPGPQSRAGTGLIRKICRRDNETQIYARKLSPGEVRLRISRYYKPYHSLLKKILDATHKKFGTVVHINCHSMPSVKPGGKKNKTIDTSKYDFIIGTVDGSTADQAYVDFIKKTLTGMGYRVGVDVSGFKGARIVRENGQPQQQRHSIQLEINRDLYMDPETLERHAGFAKLQKDLTRFTEALEKFSLQQAAQLRQKRAAKPANGFNAKSHKNNRRF